MSAPEIIGAVLGATAAAGTLFSFLYRARWHRARGELALERSRRIDAEISAASSSKEAARMAAGMRAAIALHAEAVARESALRVQLADLRDVELEPMDLETLERVTDRADATLRELAEEQRDGGSPA